MNDPSVVINELPNQGTDVVYASVSYALTPGSYIEILSTTQNSGTGAIDLTGNELDNIIYGNNGVNVLRGGGGNDVLLGFGGNDVYYITDNRARAIESSGEGTDVVYTNVSYTLEAGSHVEILSTDFQGGTGAIDLTGNALDNIIYGNNGVNALRGGGGNDFLLGFGGNDVYYITDNRARAIESSGEGTDLVYTNVSYALEAGSHIEILSTTQNSGTGAIDLTGNERDNVIYGNNGVNALRGGGGNDVLLGFGGNDVYYITDNRARAVEASGEGTDVVYTNVSYTLEAGSSVEILSTTQNAGTSAIDLTGNELDNVIYGNAGGNTLRGGGGNDVLLGFGGNDVYYITDNRAQAVESSGEGTDVVYTNVSYALGAGSHVEILSTDFQAGTGAIDLTGNEIDNVIYGNAGANIIAGGGGNDTLLGFGGADTFAFTTTPGAGNIDTVVDFATGIDKIQLSGASGQPFAALASGTLRAGTLVIGTAALDADDYLIYNSATGALSYDADGNGGGAAVQFATLSTGLSLTVGDFTVAGPANNAPAITSGATASVAENSVASTIVYQVAANDANGDRITYSLSGTDAGLLTIDANGAVRLVTPADFETKSSYSFNVVASDSAVATAKAVTLTITDVAEGGPSTPIINETAAANDSTGTAQAIDRNTFIVAVNGNLPDDDLPSATIVGSVSPGTDKDFFSITLQAGEQLILDVDGTNGLDSFLTLYNSMGQVIGDNDDLISPDPGSNPPFGHNTDSQILFRAATSGTYYFSIGSFVDDTGGTTSGAYQLNVSIGPPATAAQIQMEDVNALISGASWNHTNLTFGFPTLASQYPSDFKEVTPASKFEAFNSTQQAATIQLLQLVGNVTTLTFTQNSATPGQADLRYAESTEAEVAYAYYPTNQGSSSEGGSAWFNHTSFNAPGRGNYSWMGILHETGHALGLKHGHEFPTAISADKDSVEYSIMTYRSYPGADLEGGYSNETYGFPQTLMMYDIAALQKIYNAANYAFNSGNSVYSWSDTTGEMSINGALQGEVGNGDGIVNANENRIFMTIWDGGGTDTYNLSNYGGGTTIDLRPGEWTTTAASQLAGLGDGHFARGNIANALMFQGNTASLIENAIAGSGADTLIANQAANQLTGGGGTDTLKWMASGDAGTGALADTVTDFLSGTDKLDLSNIDAIPASGSNDAFTFIGTTAFHNVAGEVRYDVTGGHAHVFADLDGNGIADMEIIVNNNTILSGSDFML